MRPVSGREPIAFFLRFLFVHGHSERTLTQEHRSRAGADRVISDLPGETLGDSFVARLAGPGRFPRPLARFPLCAGR